MDLHEKGLLLETCVLAGKIMIENGAEMARVEDTMNRLAGAHHDERGISFVTSGIVLMGLESTKSVQMMDVTKRTTNLEKVAKVNEYSRYFVEDRITLIQLNKMLQILDYKKNDRPMSLKVLSAGILSACLMMIVGQGSWWDFVPTFLVGAISYTVYLISQKYLKTKYLDEFIASFMIGLLALTFEKWGFGLSADNMIIGSIMPLVPGIAITNAIRDIQQDDILSGMSRAVESLMIAVLIGAGIAAAFSFLKM